MGLRDFLERFRPAGVPGAPGVPVDRAADRERELASVFDLLAGSEREAAGIRQRAAAEGRCVRAEARRRADALVAEAGHKAESVRAEAAARARADAAREEEDARRAAAEAAERVRLRGQERLPAYVARAVQRARDTLDRLGERTAGP
ncbi:vacuolar-type H+-ATPase subunit E/Vma4 [Crossiella equi]|uniref:Vacuolar-type H+-ATPase subunit E/Vma4 n=1 Tax=Crossiella equi TaxID=130796 RepID=A0ABS5AQK6_9PSEU|nr:hypothetical protein [Crossiella equi]MBP2478853.1 vacuolar-type H+-ATPase subunit E/Vma4 [Crossiella equi]